MVALSIQIEGQNGLTWPRWKQLVDVIEASGLAGQFRSDHFTNANPPDKEALETIVSLTYLADHTRRVHFGTLVAPVSFRHPALLARQAAALDDLSDGRMILGVGAGWQEREHRLFGLDLGDLPTRMARFEEGLEVMTRLFHSDEPVTFEGRFFQLRGAVLLPRPKHPGGPRILIGGNGPKRTLPLAARYANIWNGTFLPPDAFREHSSILDGLIQQAGRRPGDVRRTMMHTLHFGRDMAELDRRLRWRHNNPAFAGKSLEAVVETLQSSWQAIVGTPDMVIQQIHTYAQAGVEELMLQWFELDDIDGLRAFAATVLPHV